MPLSLVPIMVLRETSRPSASNETNAVEAVLVMTLPLTSPETFSNQMPAPPLLDDLAIDDANIATRRGNARGRAGTAAQCRRRRA